MPSSREQTLADQFARDTANHELTVLHEDGLYLHLRCKQPTNGSYWFDIVTWPGVLAIRGDVGRGFMFSRERDMVEFFRSDKGRINPHYWAQKTEGGQLGCRSYSEEGLKAIVLCEVRDYVERPPGLLLAVQNELFRSNIAFEDDAREALERFDYKGFRFDDVWEWDLYDYDWSFLWCCHAIVWAIRQYDALKVAPKAEAMS